MNRYSKKQSAFIFQIFATFIDEITDEQYESILNGTSTITIKSDINKLSNTNSSTKESNLNNTAGSILKQIKLSDRNKANIILSDTSIDKQLCLEILNTLNVKVNKRCKKETLVEKILDSIFNNDNNSSYDDLIKQLKAVKTREQARTILVSSKLKVSELKRLASIMNISLIEKTKDKIIYSIVQRVIGDKLDVEAIMSVKLK